MPRIKRWACVNGSRMLSKLFRGNFNKGSREFSVEAVAFA